MKKGKLFITLFIIILILIFAVAANCNLCGTSVTIEDVKKTTDDQVIRNSTDSSESNRSSTEDENISSQDTADVTETEQDISVEDGVEADSEEESSGNIENNSEHGQDNGREGSEDQIEIKIYEVLLSSEYSGSVPLSIKDGSYGSTDMQRLIIGEYDAQEWTSQAFLTFKPSQLSSNNTLITDATLFIDFVDSNGDTSRFNNISLGTVDWGDGPPGSFASEQEASRIIDTYPSSLHDDISCSSIALQEEIQRLVDNNRLLQFKIYFTGSPLNNSDGSVEYIEYSKPGTKLVVHYIVE